jgi:hypothetical protein
LEEDFYRTIRSKAAESNVSFIEDLIKEEEKKSEKKGKK